MFKSVAFRVIGDQKLHCVSCEQRVVRILNCLTGIRQVRADAPSQRIEVLFDSDELEESIIVERLGQLGYKTEVMIQPAHSNG